MIHLRYDNAKIRVYLESVVNQYNNTLNAINYMIRLSNQPKFKLKLGTAQSFREKQADGTDKIVTKDMYAEKIKRLLESEDITVMTESEGVSLEKYTDKCERKSGGACQGLLGHKTTKQLMPLIYRKQYLMAISQSSQMPPMNLSLMLSARLRKS